MKKIATSTKFDLNILYAQANKCIDNGEFKEALVILKQILQNSEPVKRQETSSEIIDAYQGIPDDIKNIQDRYIGGKKITLIIDYFTAACYLSGYCFTVIKEYEMALKYLEQAMILWPRNNTIRHEIAYIYTQLRQFNEALIILQEALDNDSKDSIANKEIAWIYNEQGLYEQAIPYAQAAIKLDPQIYKAYEELAIAYVKTGKEKELDELEKVMNNLKAKNK